MKKANIAVGVPGGQSFDSRRKELEDIERKEAEAAERAKKNNDFFMVFKKDGSPVIRNLIGVAPIAARVFLLLAEQADRTNAIVASQIALANALGVSKPSITRAVKTLLEKKLIEVLKSGGTNVFILNPEVVWSAWKTGKDYCLFGNAKVLVSKNEQDLITRKRLNVLLEKQQALDLEEGTETPPEALEAPQKGWDMAESIKNATGR